MPGVNGPFGCAALSALVIQVGAKMFTFHANLSKPLTGFYSEPE
jgi:hypothetical protein